MGSFRRVRSTFLFTCSLTSNLNKSNLKSASKTKRRNKTHVQNLEITLRIPQSPTFFGTVRLFFETFWIAPKGPFICFDILQHNGCKTIPKGPPFTFFGTVTLFKNLINFFSEIFKNLSAFIFSYLFCNPLEFHKARRVPPFTILSLRYSADFGRSRLVKIFKKEESNLQCRKNPKGYPLTSESFIRIQFYPYGLIRM